MYRVMIVDDEPLFRDYLRMKMGWEQYGFTVCCEARNGREALEEAQQHRPHLALIDINMPFMNGLDLAKQLKLRFADMTIVFVSGHNEFEYVRQAVRLGVNDYLLKPFNREELAAMLERIRPSLPRLPSTPAEELASSGAGGEARPETKPYNAAAIQENLLVALRLNDNDTLAELKRSIQPLKQYGVKDEYAYTMLMGIVSIGLSFAGEKGLAAGELWGGQPESAPDKQLRTFASWEEAEEWLLAFFDRLTRLAADVKATKSSKLYAAAKAYIEAHYPDEELSVEAVAAGLFVDPSYLRRVFRKESGYSVLDHIQHIRMKKAKELLQQGNLKLSGVAAAVGYADANYFSKSFKKQFGMTPTEFEQLKYPE